jgi:hypothetical protein
MAVFMAIISIFINYFVILSYFSGFSQALHEKINTSATADLKTDKTNPQLLFGPKTCLHLLTSQCQFF